MQKFKLKFASFFRQLPKGTVYGFQKNVEETSNTRRQHLVLLYKI
jgi:hypothetical protein